MTNGHFSQLLDEVRQHWQHIGAAAGAVRSALPVSEWIRIAVVAVVTAVVTSQITIARLDERINALRELRTEGVSRRDEQIRKLEQRDAELEKKLDLMLQKLAIIEGKIK